MNRHYSLYLLWSTQGWEVSRALPAPKEHKPLLSYAYRKYEFPEEKIQVAQQRLEEKRSELEKRHEIPTRHNAQQLFPQLSELLA